MLYSVWLSCEMTQAASLLFASTELERDLPGIQLRRNFLLVGLWLMPDTGRKLGAVDSLEPSIIVELTCAETLRPLGSGKGAVCRVLSPCIGGRESLRCENEMLRGL